MRHLLIAFLLLVFSIQATVVAMGEDPIAAVKAQQRQAHAPADTLAVPDSPDSSGSLAEHHAEDEADGSDGLDGSSMIDELSDYLPGGPWFLDAAHPVATRTVSSIFFLSADLPSSRPPPRA